MSKNIKTIPTSQYDEVIATVMKYVDGLRIGDSTHVAQAFHNEAIMYGLHGAKVLGGHIKSLYDFVDQHGDAPEIKVRLDVLAITPTTAVVRVDMRRMQWAPADYTDFHDNSIVDLQNRTARVYDTTSLHDTYRARVSKR